LNPKQLVQFSNSFIEIPIAPATTPDIYTATVRKNDDWDFGLRMIDPITGTATRPKDPLTGQTIKTPTWYYDVNGAALGIYGATVEATSNSPVSITYVNDLRDEIIDPASTALVKGQKGTGPLLTKHLLTIDPTVDGMSGGEPEVRIVTHMHGGHVDWRYDGHPEAWVTNLPASQQTSINNGAGYALAADPSRGFPGRPADNKVTYHYPNDDMAATLWFHDHSLGITRLNAYSGVAAFFIRRDAAETALGLPGTKGANPVVPSLQSYKYDLPVVIQDKAFNTDGTMEFPTFTNLGVYTYNALRDKNGNAAQTVRPEMFGNVIVVNGQAWPVKNVEQTGYRFRIVNGSDSRVYNLWLQDADTGEIITKSLATTKAPTLNWPIIQLAAEQGLFPKAVEVATNWQENGLTIANGERADIVIDFSHPVFQNNGKGRRLILRNDAPAPFGGKFGPSAEDMTTLDPVTTGKVMMFVVSNTAGSSYNTKIGTWKTALRPYNGTDNQDLSGTTPARTRYIDFQERKDSVYSFFDPIANTTFYRTQLLINGLRFSDPITEKPTSGTVEDWVIINTTPDMHPLHLHLVRFQVLEKGHIKAGPTGTYLTALEAQALSLPADVSPAPDYIRADGAGALPAAIAGYTAYAKNIDPGSCTDPKNPTTCITLVPDTTSNNLYTRSGNETGWKDTVKVPPALVSYNTNGATGEVVNPGYIKIRAKFDMPAGADTGGGKGATYMYHCHILSHEEHEMMRPFTVVP
jgi:spore coat protein A